MELRPSFKFGRFELDPEAGELRKDGHPVPLQPKPLLILTHLLENAGRLVDAKELTDVVWPDVHVAAGSLDQAISRIRKALGESSREDGFVETVPRRGYRFRRRAERAVVSPDRSHGGHAIAVIPRLEDRSLAYLTEGIAEGIIERLTRTPRLRVLAPSTAFRFEEGDLDLGAMHRDLDVSSVASVSTNIEGEQAEVEIKVTRTNDSVELLRRHYSGAVDRPASIVENAARDLLSTVRPRAATKRRRTRSLPHDPAAYQLYLKARYQWNKRSPDGAKNAMDLYQQTIEIDPTFAPAYVGLADAFNLIGFLEVAPPMFVFPKAKAAARRAIEIDPSSGDAYASLGFAAGMYDWNPRESVRLLDESLHRNPGYAWAHQWRGLTGLLPLRRFDEALRCVQRAEELDPLAPIMSAAVGSVLMYARRHEESRQYLERARDLEAGVGCTHMWLGLTYVQLGRFDDAIASLERAQVLEPIPATTSALCHCYAAAGRRDKALELLDRMMSTGHCSKLVPLLTYIGLGEESRALDALHVAIEERISFLSLANVDPRFDRVREWMGPGRLEALFEEHMLASDSMEPVQ